MPLPDQYVQNKLKAYFSSQIQVLCQDTNPHYFPSPVLLCIFKSNLFAYLPGSRKRASPPGRWHGHQLQTSRPCPLPACCQRVFKNKTEVIGGEGTDEELGRSCIAEQSGFVCVISYQTHSSLCKLPGDKLQHFFYQVLVGLLIEHHQKPLLGLTVTPGLSHQPKHTEIHVAEELQGGTHQHCAIQNEDGLIYVCIYLCF